MNTKLTTLILSLSFCILSPALEAAIKNKNQTLLEIQVLNDSLLDDPDNPEMLFALAEKYRSISQLQNALDAYIKRTKAEGSKDETYWSLLQVAFIKEVLQYPFKEFFEAYVQAFECDPSRAEAVYHMTRYFNSIGKHQTSYVYAQYVLEQAIPTDTSLVEPYVYDYGLLYEYGIAALQMEDVEGAHKAFSLLLEKPTLPKWMIPIVQELLQQLS